MKIMIVSRDIFFISGAIELIAQAWRPDYHQPIFMVARENHPLLLPDVVILDTLAAEMSQRNRAGGLQSHERVVKIFLAAQHRESKKNRYPEVPVILDKKEAANQLVSLFVNKNSPLFLSSSLSHLLHHSLHHVGMLSKQQAMVLKYIRQGLSLTDISHVTQLSVKTISTHKRAIMRKLGIKNNGEFYQYAFGDLPRYEK